MYLLLKFGKNKTVGVQWLVYVHKIIMVSKIIEKAKNNEMCNFFDIMYLVLIKCW